jgi:hypothetical protein
MTERTGRFQSSSNRWQPRIWHSREAVGEDDPAARTLAHLARSVLDRVSHVLCDTRQASQTAVRLRAYEDGCGEDRAWRFSWRSTETYCVLSEHAERELLRLIVGGVSRGRLSEIERRITGEAVSRLLGSSGEADVTELRRERPGAPTWGCSVRLSAGDESCAVLEFFVPCSAPVVRPERGPNIASVALPLRATLSCGSCELGSVMKWQTGSLVRLQRGLDVSAIVFAGGRRIAQGRLGSLYGERALMLTAVSALL